MASTPLAIGLVLGAAALALLAREGADRLLRRRAARRWADAGIALSLTADAVDGAPFPRLAGERRARQVEAWVDELRREGRTEQFLRLRVGLDLPAMPELFARGRRLGQPELSWPELRTGRGAFDNEIRVSAPDRLAAAAWLTDARCEALRRLEASGLHWSVGNGWIGLSHDHVPLDAGALGRFLDVMLEAAEALVDPVAEAPPRR